MATTYEVDRQAAAVMALNAKHIVQQCDALLARLAVVYADHYERQQIEDMVRGCRVLADSAAITFQIDADWPANGAHNTQSLVESMARTASASPVVRKLRGEIEGIERLDAILRGESRG